MLQGSTFNRYPSYACYSGSGLDSRGLGGLGGLGGLRTRGKGLKDSTTVQSRKSRLTWCCMLSRNISSFPVSFTRRSESFILSIAVTLAGCDSSEPVTVANPDATVVITDADSCVSCQYNWLIQTDPPSGGVLEVRQAGYDGADCTKGFDYPTDSASLAGAPCDGTLDTAPQGQCAFTLCSTTTCCGTRAYTAALCTSDKRCAPGPQACETAKMMESILTFCSSSPF
jgi:hypothetical protein